MANLETVTFAHITASLGVVALPADIDGNGFVDRQRMADVAHQLESLGFRVVQVAAASFEVTAEQKLFSMLLGVATPWSLANFYVLKGQSGCLDGLVGAVVASPTAPAPDD